MNENSIALRFGSLGLALRYPAALDEEIWPYFEHLPEYQQGEPSSLLHLRPATGKCLDLYNDGRLVWHGLVWPDALHAIFDEIARIVAAQASQPMLRAAAVQGEGKPVLIIGPPGASKTGLAAWLVSQGFAFLADNLVGIAGRTGEIEPVPLALSPHAAIAPRILAWPSFAHAYATITGQGAIIKIAPRPAEQACGLILVPLFHEGASLAIEAIPVERLRFLLEQAVHPDQTLSSAATDALAGLASAVPAALVKFGNYQQLADVLDTFIHNTLRAELKPAELPRLLKSQRLQSTGPSVAPMAQPALARPRKRLSIGMATYDDYDGVYFTLQALRLYHPEVGDDIEFLVVDNNPEGICGEALRKLGRSIPGYRYVPMAETMGTAIRDMVMCEASSDFVMCLDCHVLVVPGAIAKLLRYFEANPSSVDLLQGPLVNDNLTTISTHWKPGWHGGMFGAWALDEAGRAPDAAPFEIPMQGLGLYACRREAWPGYNPHFRGFGGEEFYIHEKFRRAGRRTLCLPFLRWLHRFERPMGAPYRISWHDRIRNYMIGFDELGLPAEDMLAHFRTYIGPTAEPIIQHTWRELEQMKAGAGAGFSERAASGRSAIKGLV